MPERSYRPLLYALALFGLLADQASKYGVFAWLAERPGNRYTLFHGPSSDRRGAEEEGPGAAWSPAARAEHSFALEVMFERGADGKLTPHVNHGALFGFLRDYETLANLTFAAVSLLAAVGIVLWARLPGTARDGVLCAALGLILAGTLGNLYDRLMFNGVRDFLHWNIWFDWPVFNIADCCLVCGAALMLLQAFFGRQPSPATPAESLTASAPRPHGAEPAATAVTTASKA